jgi:dTDP-4-dehydrorhamnose reductase
MTKRRVAIIGSNGQLGHDLVRSVDAAAWDLRAFVRADFDICDHDAVTAALEAFRPDVVIDLAAFHKMEVCEADPGRTFAVNATAVHHLARETARLGAAFVFMSSDYVFAGDEPTPRVESDRCAPISIYGLSKRAGERLALNGNPNSYVIRVSGLYGEAGPSGKGSNFVDTMMRLGREGKPLRVVDDQVLTPTFTPELSRKIWRMLKAAPPGLYHCSNNGQCSWHDFAAEIFRLARLPVDLSRQTTAESGATAPRPAYSVLDNRALRDLGLDDMRPWQEALAEYLHIKHNI